MGEPSEVVIPLFGVLDVTGEVITMWLIIAVLAVLSIILGKHLQERPGKLQNVIEWGIEYLDNSFTDNLGKKRARKYFYFLGSLFIFIIFANYSGLIPGVGLSKYLKAPTSSLSVTAGLGVCTFFFLQGASIRAKGLKGYFKHFISPIIVMLPLLALAPVSYSSTTRPQASLQCTMHNAQCTMRFTTCRASALVMHNAQCTMHN